MNFDNRGIFGLDVSHWEDNNETPQQIDYQKMKAYGTQFVGVKVGQLSRPDEDFIYNWTKAREAGIPRMAYWFGDATAKGKVQAHTYWDLIKSDPGEGPCFIDYEKYAWTDWNELYNFIYEFQQISGLPSNKIGIYTGYYYWVEHSPAIQSKKDWFGQFNLWLAWYASQNDVIVPSPWKLIDGQPLIWQDSTPPLGILVGAESKEIDHNFFNGDSVRFSNYFGTEVPPTGEPMTVLYYADLKAGLTSNARPAPATSSTPATPITGPVTVNITSEKITAGGYDWYQINSPVSGYIALTTSYEHFRPAVQTNHIVEVFVDGVSVYRGEF